MRFYLFLISFLLGVNAYGAIADWRLEIELEKKLEKLMPNLDKSLDYPGPQEVLNRLAGGSSIFEMRRELTVAAAIGKLEEFNELFDELMGIISSRLEKLKLDEDKVLISFFDLLGLRYKRDPNYNFPLDRVSFYFKERIHFLKRTGRLQGSFRVFSGLNSLYQDDKKLLAILLPIYQSEQLKLPITDSMADSYARITQRSMVEGWSQQVQMKYLKSFELIANYSLDILQSVEGNKSIDRLYSYLDLYCALFDRHSDYYKKLSKNDWINLLDKRSELMFRFWSILKNSENENLIKSFALGIFPKHPYARIYLMRAFMEKSEELAISSNIDFKLEDGISQLEEEIIESFNGSLDKENLKSAYRHYFYRVEFKRFLLEWESFKRKKPEFKTESLSVKLYRSLLLDLIEANNKRYEKNFSLNDFQRRAETLLNGLNSEIEEDGIRLIQLCKISRECGEKTLSAGIYYSIENLTIEGDGLRFHPLAMIFAPGKLVRLKIRTLSNPWIDVSGNLPLRTKRTPEKINQTNLKPQQLHEGSGANQTWRIQAGSSPIKQTKGNKGNKAGSIEVITFKASEYLPLYVAMGGNGSDGYAGSPSPQCIKNNYRPSPFIVGRIYDEIVERTRSEDYPCGPLGSRDICVRKVPYTTNERRDTRSYGQFSHTRRGESGDGGDGGDGGRVFLSLWRSRDLNDYQNNIFLNPGYPGNSGKVNQCGPNSDDILKLQGSRGAIGYPGEFEYR